MQQYLTLEEAANYLQTSTDEMRELAKKKIVRAFQDKGSWRFRSQDIHEIARVRGLKSEGEMEIGEIEKKMQSKSPVKDSSHQLTNDLASLNESNNEVKATNSNTPSKPSNPGSDSDVRLVLDSNLDFQLEDDVKSSSIAEKEIKGPNPQSESLTVKSEKGDSDVKLEKGNSKSLSDSDIRLQNDLSGSKGDLSENESGIITEEIDLDAEHARHLHELQNREKNQGKGVSEPLKPKLSIEKSSSRDSSSDFELIPFESTQASGKKDLNPDSLLSGIEVTASNHKNNKDSNQNRINHQAPSDSGISLEGISSDSGKTGGKKESKIDDSSEDDSSSEFELTLDGGPSEDGSSSEFELSMDEPLGVPDSSSEFELSLDGTDSSVIEDAPSDSEFELTLDDEGSLALEKDGEDIFEETTFDVPALEDDSGSEAIALDESGTELEESDFDISIDEESTSTEKSESQVVALEDEEEADDAATTIAKPRKIGKKSNLISKEDDDDSLESKGKKKTKKLSTDDDDLEDGLDEESQHEAIQEPKEWGSLPAVILFPTVIVLFLVGIMSFELLRGMFGYHRSTVVGKPLVDNLARMLDDSLPK